MAVCVLQAMPHVESSLAPFATEGGVGIGKAINGGFAVLTAARKEQDHPLGDRLGRQGGVARRAWAKTAAMKTSQIYNETQAGKFILPCPIS